MPLKDIEDMGGALYMNGEKICNVKEMTVSTVEPEWNSGDIDIDSSAWLRLCSEIRQIAYADVFQYMLGRKGRRE